MDEAEFAPTEWCPTCRRRVQVVDSDVDVTYEGLREVEHRWTGLACGHTTSQRTGQVARAPF